MEIAVLLHNIRSAHNVGSIFRTSDAAGVSRVFLSGYTPLPLDRFGRARKDIAKTALGAERTVPWEHKKSPLPVISDLRAQGWRIISVEQTSTALPYTEMRREGKTLFIFGNEVRGISKSLIEKSDAVVEIPMRGKKESLNVSVAAGIILFETTR